MFDLLKVKVQENNGDTYILSYRVAKAPLKGIPLCYFYLSEATG